MRGRVAGTGWSGATGPAAFVARFGVELTRRQSAGAARTSVPSAAGPRSGARARTAHGVRASILAICRGGCGSGGDCRRNHAQTAVLSRGIKDRQPHGEHARVIGLGQVDPAILVPIGPAEQRRNPQMLRQFAFRRLDARAEDVCVGGIARVHVQVAEERLAERREARARLARLGAAPGRRRRARSTGEGGDRCEQEGGGNRAGDHPRGCTVRRTGLSRVTFAWTLR